MILETNKTKISALFIFIFIVGSVFTFNLNKIQAQGGFEGGDFSTVTHTDPDGNQTTSYSQNRVQNNVQASREQAQNIQQNQQQDMQQCMSEGSALQGPMNNALQTGLDQIMSDTLNESLPEAVKEKIVEKLPEELNKATKELLPTKLGDRIKADLNASMEGLLAEATADLGRPLTNLEKTDIFKNELSDSIQNNFANAFKDSVRESFPTAIENSIRTGLPEALSSVLRNELPGQISNKMPGIMEQELGPQIANMLIDQFASITDGGNFDPTSLLSLAPSLIEGLASGLEDLGNNLGNFLGDLFGIEREDDDAPNLSDSTRITPEVIGGVTDAMIDEYTAQTIDLLNDNMDNIIAEANSALDESMDEIIASIEGELDEVLDDTLGELTGTIDAALEGVFDELTGPFEELIDGTLDSLDGVFDGLTGVFNETTGALTGAINEVTNTLTGTLSGALNEVTGTLTGTLNQVVSSITTPINNAISGVVSNVISPITDSITGAITTPINNITSNLTENILNPVTGAFDGVIGNVTSGLTGAAGDITSNVLANAGVPDVIAGPVGDAVSNVASGVVSNIPGIGAITGIAGIGVFVPVKETSGPLLSSTQSIDKSNASIDATTQRIEALTIEICTYLKSIKRIQTAFEQKEFVEDVDLRRQANEASEQYRNEIIDFTKTGYDSTGEGPDAPLYVENPIAHVDELVVPEATRVYLDDLKKSQNSFKDITASQLIGELNRPAGYSSISQEEYNSFVQGEVSDSQNWFNTFIAMKNPFEPNTPETSFKLSSQALNRARVRAETDFYQQLVAGEGYLPVRECVERTEDNSACRRWQVVTPASQVQDVAAEALNYRLDLYKNAEPGDVSPGGGPTLEETRTNTPSASGGGGGNPGGAINQILELLSNLFNRNNTNNNSQSNNTIEISLSHSTPTPQEIGSGTNNVAEISWTTEGATSCVATSDWISSSNNILGGPLILTAGLGSELETNGSRNITLPIQFSNPFRKNTNVNLLPVTTTDSHIFQSHKLVLTDEILNSLNPGDNITIFLWPYKISVPIVAGDSPATLINKLYQEAINASTSQIDVARASVFRQYTFTPNSASKSLAIKPKLKYQISCRNNTGNETQEIINLN